MLEARIDRFPGVGRIRCALKGEVMVDAHEDRVVPENHHHEDEAGDDPAPPSPAGSGWSVARRFGNGCLLGHGKATAGVGVEGDQGGANGSDTRSGGDCEPFAGSGGNSSKANASIAKPKGGSKRPGHVATPGFGCNRFGGGPFPCAVRGAVLLTRTAKPRNLPGGRHRSMGPPRVTLFQSVLPDRAENWWVVDGFLCQHRGQTGRRVAAAEVTVRPGRI